MSKEAFKNYVVRDLLGHLPNITARAIFGGYGIYQDRYFFAVIVGDELFFKVDDSNRADYQASGSHPWTYRGGNKQVTMGYWLLPEAILENPAEVGEWVTKSVAVAKSKKSKNLDSKPAIKK